MIRPFKNIPDDKLDILIKRNKRQLGMSIHMLAQEKMYRIIFKQLEDSI